MSPNILFVADWGNYRLRKITLGDFCANATVISGNSGTQNIGLINEGVPDIQCGVSNQYFDANAKWFQYTPTQNGLLTISANTPQNTTTVNTLLTVLYQPTNLCNNMTCYAFNNNISATDLRSELINLDVVAGTKYYIVWSDFYTDNQAVNFNYSFTPTNCLSTAGLNVATENTENTVNLAWQTPLGGTSPMSYTLEIGPLNYAVGSGSALQTTTINGNTVSFNGLTASTFYDIYIKSNCSATESSIWAGPIRVNTEFASAPLTYTQNFDSNTNFLNLGFNRFNSTLNSRFTSYSSGPSALTQSGSNSVYSFMDKTTLTESLIFLEKLV
ncbi:MAG: fibronectin type III domain-containing protein [Flavobacterium sp.]|nr:fibronectin type III domain-containing protein [Flavobacterium sp.]